MHSGASKPPSAISGSSLGKVNTSQESDERASENPNAASPGRASGADSANSNVRRGSRGRPDSQAKPSPGHSARSSNRDGKHFKPGATVILSSNPILEAP